MRQTVLLVPLLLLCMTMTTAEASAEEQRPGRGQQQAGWTTFARGGGIYQGDADLDKGGSYSSSRFNIEVGHGYGWSSRTSVSLALSYTNDNYSFAENKQGGFSAGAPWDTVHTYSISAPVRMEMSESWSVLLIPSIRSTGESSAEFEDTVTGGAIAGFAYRFGDRLTIGPGLGVLSQLEESVSVFPFLVIDWQITDRLSLETGRGLAATQGPGLTLTYRPDEHWSFGVGGRYEKLRFRLDEAGDIPGGIGEETSIPLFFSCSYDFTRKVRLSFVGGVEAGAELQVEDAEGNTIAEESADPSFFGGMTFNIRL